MRSILIKLIIYIGLKNQTKFLKLLSKLEFGVYIFCKKLAEEAYSQNYENLANQLLLHAKDEKKHANLIAIFNNTRIKLKNTGRWASFYSISTGEELAPFPDIDENEGTKIFYQNTIGKFQSFDGMSKRYLALRVLFNGKKASDLDWCDRIAFMHVLETGTSEFYKQLAMQTQGKLSAIASEISEDEIGHSEKLKLFLGNFTLFPHQEIDKWESRINLSMWALLWDLYRAIK